MVSSGVGMWENTRKDKGRRRIERDDEWSDVLKRERRGEKEKETRTEMKLKLYRDREESKQREECWTE